MRLPRFSRLLPTRSVRWLICSSTVLLLAACGTADAPLSSAVTVDAQPDMTTPSAELAPPALSMAERLAALSEPPGMEPGQYGLRADARELALQIADAHRLPPDWVWSQLAQARFRERIPVLMMPPAGGHTAKDWEAYRARFIEPIRTRAGVRFWQEHADTLARAEQQWGVPSRIIVGIIGVETIYGRQTGQYRVIDALTTLSLDFPRGRSDRSTFFRRELGQYLAWCHDQQRDPQTVRGSYAGAMGWPQFMPSSIRRFGVDFDGDGRVDLMNSPADVIGSVANYLAQHGWQSGQSTHFSVVTPSETASLETLLAPDIVPSFLPTEMQALGARLPAAALAHPGKLALVELQNGGRRPTRVAGTANFFAITRYNQSSYYAMAVIQLGDAVANALPGAGAKP